MITLYVKNMVCNRCIMMLKQVVEELCLITNSIILGELQLNEEPTTEQIVDLKLHLAELGFEILEDSKKRLIERIKNFIV